MCDGRNSMGYNGGHKSGSMTEQYTRASKLPQPHTPSARALTGIRQRLEGGTLGQGQFLQLPQVARGAGEVGELGVVAQVELLQGGAGGDLVRQAAQVVRGQRQLLDGCVVVYGESGSDGMSVMAFEIRVASTASVPRTSNNKQNVDDKFSTHK